MFGEKRKTAEWPNIRVGDKLVPLDVNDDDDDDDDEEDDDDVQWFNVHLKADWKPAFSLAHNGKVKSDMPEKNGSTWMWSQRGGWKGRRTTEEKLCAVCGNDEFWVWSGSEE